MNWYKKAKAETLWHLSNQKFDAFDPYMTAQGIIWFSKDKNDLLQNLHGASINKNKPVYLYECKVNMIKTAGWDEYDKYGISQLRSMGFDSINLDDDVAVLNVKNITISNLQEVII